MSANESDKQPSSPLDSKPAPTSESPPTEAAPDAAAPSAATPQTPPLTEAALRHREAQIQESEKLAAEIEAEAGRIRNEARAELESARTKNADCAQREKVVEQREKAADKRELQVNSLKGDVEQREKAVEQREQKAKQRQGELDQKDEKRKEADRELKRREAEVERRDRTVKERELEAEAGFAALNRTALAAMEKEHAALRGQLAALQREIQEAREKGFAALDADLARERARRIAAQDAEISDRRSHDEQQLKQDLERESARVRADHDRRTKAVEEREQKLRSEQERWRNEMEQASKKARAESEKERTALNDRERGLELREHKLRVGEEVLRADQVQLEEKIRLASQERVTELEVRLAESERRCADRLDQILRVEARLDSFKELERRFEGQAPEEVLAERERLATEASRLRRELDNRPTLEDKQRLAQLVLERDKLEKELTDSRRKLASLTADRTKWALSVADLEHQRSLKESEERRRQALEAQNERLADEVERLRKLYEAPQDKAKRIESIEKPWEEKLIRAEEDPALTETGWLDRIVEDCRGSGLEFPRRLIVAFHTALKTADWSPIAVLAGVSGTGKSELPRLYARFGGLAFMPRPVQPNWDSPQSLFGFFNSIDNRFDATPLLQALVQSQKNPDDPDHPHGFADRLLLMLLDEMNLAHVEQYFSDLLSKLEERRGMKGGVSVDIELGGGLKYPVPMGRNVLWVGTMNEDETTKSLSDKVIDRSNLIYFPRPQKLRRRIDATLRDPRPLLPRRSWESWIVPKSPFSDEDVAPYKEALERMNEYLETVGRALGHRVWQAMEHYMANHPDVVDAFKRNDEEAKKKSMRRAFEDQLVQKAMPKLRGIETSGAARSKCLDPIQKLFNEIGLHLDDDFTNALRVGAGAFVWNSARYVEADA